MQAVYITADKCHCCSTLHSTSSPHGGCKYIQYRVAQKSHATNWATQFEETHKIFILSIYINWMMFYLMSISYGSDLYNVFQNRHIYVTVLQINFIESDCVILLYAFCLTFYCCCDTSAAVPFSSVLYLFNSFVLCVWSVTVLTLKNLSLHCDIFFKASWSVAFFSQYCRG